MRTAPLAFGPAKVTMPAHWREQVMRFRVLLALFVLSVVANLAQAQPRFQCHELACPEGGMAFGPYPFCSCPTAPPSCQFGLGAQYICTPLQSDPFITPEISCECIGSEGDPDRDRPPEPPTFCQAFCPDGSTPIQEGLTCLCRSTFEAPPTKRAPSERTAAGRIPASQYSASSAWNRLHMTLRPRPAYCATVGRAG